MTNSSQGLKNLAFPSPNIYEGYYIRLVVKVLDLVWEVEGVDLWLLSHIGI